MQSKSKNSRYTLREEEQRLLAACLKDDPQAQKELYDRYKDAMFTLAYRICSDFELAQDVSRLKRSNETRIASARDLLGRHVLAKA